jgi:hypothetical protein
MRRLIFLSIFAIHFAISFAIKRTFKMILSNSNRGFGRSVLNSKASNPKDSIIQQQIEMEKEIQNKINSIQNLREVVNLKEEIHAIEKLTSNLNLIEQLTTISPTQQQNIESKTNRIAELKSLGWDEKAIHNKLLEITWDVAASHRNTQHEKNANQITNEMNRFMETIASNALHGDFAFNGKILDVGCGDGILLQYLKNTQKTLFLQNLQHQNNKKKTKDTIKKDQNIEENYYSNSILLLNSDYCVINKPHDVRMDGDFEITVEKLVK